METAPQIVTALLARGFTVLDQVVELGNGRPQAGLPIKGVTYLSRAVPAARHPDTVKLGAHLYYDQYASVIASPFDAALHLETVIEEYHVPRARKACPGGLDSHSRMERGFGPVYAMIRRDLPAILADLDAPHPLPAKQARTASSPPPRPAKRS